MSLKRIISSAATLLAVMSLAVMSGFGAEPAFKTLSGNVPQVLSQLIPEGLVPATNELRLSLGLPLHNQDQLDTLIGQLYDPHGTNYHKFLTPEEFTSRFGPTEQEYAAVVQFAESKGLRVTRRHGNRVVLDVTGRATDVEHAFQITLRTYKHPKEARNFFASDTDPSVPTNLPVADIWGLSDYARPRPLLVRAEALKTTPLNYNGSGPYGTYQGADFRNAYVPGSGLNGAGQTVALVELDGYYPNDITNYEAQCGYPNVPVQNILLDGVTGEPGYSGEPNAVAEVSLDIEMIISMAPGLSQVIVYEGENPYDVFNSIATANTAKQVSCSWAFGYGPTHSWTRKSKSTLDSILSEMVLQGQAFFQAAGDDDAYTGSQALSHFAGPIPVDSIYVTSVGGTSLTMNGGGASWSSETVWNWGDNQGTGGGVSPNYTIPSWQTGINMSSNGGSSATRNIPDVALTADAVNVVYSNGLSSSFGGTSCAAPLWAGFCALINEQAVGSGDAGAGFLNPALYAIGKGTNYAACFHDITSGNNIGDNTEGDFVATGGYDLCTGWGTPNGTNLINALAPLGQPFFTSQPVGQNAAVGTSVTFSATVSGASPLGFQWLLNGTNFTDGGNISGSATNILSITGATTNNAGNYSLVVINTDGSVTSSIAILNVGFAPAISTQPTNVVIPSGGNTTFSVTVGGSTPLAYQWQQNGTNLANGSGISGVTSNVLTLTTVTTNASGIYALYVTNLFGTAISSTATLFVYIPPAITSSSLTNQTVQCGSNNLAFAVTVSGTPPPTFQWSLDGITIPEATNTLFSLTNLDEPNHIISLVVANPYGSLTNSAVVTVQDTLPPVITLNGANPFYVELGSSFTDSGATANDLCMGAVSVGVGGSVNPNVIGSYTLTYSANDGNGNTGTVTRTVIVRDTTPPTILRSFTNLVLAANTNCGASMPNVAGTNDILVTDLSEPLTITQNPTNGSALLIGTNTIVIVAIDAYGNTAYSTNSITVQDQTPPLILSQPQSLTNLMGGTASFNVAATACTPETYQWFFTNAILTGATNNTLTLSNLTLALAGNYFVIATAAGGSATSALASLTVDRPVSGTLASSENPSGFHDLLNFTETVTPANVSGTIQFYTNGEDFDLETLTAGQAISAGISSLPRGTNLITAVYSGDASDASSTNTLYQVVTNHPPTVSPAFFTRAAGTVMDIPVTQLAMDWNDVDGDTVSLASVRVSTNGVIVTNSSGVLTYLNTNNVSDQFTCTITDGFGGTNYQTVNIAVAFPIISVAPGNHNGGITLNLDGAPGQTYVLEVSSNLIPPVIWLPMATNTLGTNGVWQFADPRIANFPQRFFRLGLAP